MYGDTGGPCSSDEFVKVEKETNGGLYTCAFHISHDVLYTSYIATEKDDPRKGKDGQKQFCIREYVYNDYSGN